MKSSQSKNYYNHFVYLDVNKKPQQIKKLIADNYSNRNGIPRKIDILLVTGDMYIDHPSFGIAIIARTLNNAGFSVFIASRPEYYNRSYLELLPEPVLFTGITAGNMDSIVSNYTGSRNPRQKDTYSIDGKTDFPNGIKQRPDRATIIYTSFIRQKFKNTPVVIGGIEASLRRFVHYDFVQQKLRRSILVDSKADILVYSMGEKSILEIADRFKNKKNINGINGTCIKIQKNNLQQLDSEKLFSWDEISANRLNLMINTKIIEANMTHDHAEVLSQDQGGSIVVSYKPAPSPTEKELDAVYSLPFKKDFPDYSKNIPAWSMIKDSITSHRGCYGRCSFCAIASHQGPQVISRSNDSIFKEVLELSSYSFFKKTITDIGGPTANMYKSSCKIGWCRDPHCLFPVICPNLILDKNSYIKLLKQVKNIPGIKNVFVSSGLRHEIALEKKAETEWIITNATSGHFKIAPEHIDNKILSLMKKPENEVFVRFLEFFNEIKKRNRLNFYILPYIILSHPGSTVESAHKLGNFLKENRISTRQYQDFTPTPQTLSTAMYFSGKDPEGNPLYIPSFSGLKNDQRKVLEFYLKYSFYRNKKSTK